MLGGGGESVVRSVAVEPIEGGVASSRGVASGKGVALGGEVLSMALGFPIVKKST